MKMHRHTHTHIATHGTAIQCNAVRRMHSKKKSYTKYIRHACMHTRADGSLLSSTTQWRTLHVLLCFMRTFVCIYNWLCCSIVDCCIRLLATQCMRSYEMGSNELLALFRIVCAAYMYVCIARKKECASNRCQSVRILFSTIFVILYIYSFLLWRHFFHLYQHIFNLIPWPNSSKGNLLCPKFI